MIIIILFIGLENQGKNSIKMSSKEKKYFVATQDKELRQILGSRTGIPLIYLNNVTFVLEPPSNYSKEASKKVQYHLSYFNIYICIYTIKLETLKDSLNEDELLNINKIRY